MNKDRVGNAMDSVGELKCLSKQAAIEGIAIVGKDVSDETN